MQNPTTVHRSRRFEVRYVAALVVMAACGCGKAHRDAPTADRRPSGGATDARGSWAKRFGDANAQSVTAVAVDATGGVLAAGYGCAGDNGQRGTIDFGAGPKVMPGECGLFVVAYSQDGKIRWSFMDGEPEVKTEASAMTMLHGGGILVAGDKDRDLLLDVLAPDGVRIASHRFPHGQSGETKARAVSVTANGDWLVAGVATRRVDLGTGPYEHIGSVPFVARYSPEGKARWVRYGSVDSKYDAAASAVAQLDENTIVACGRTDVGDERGFIQALDAQNGEVRWTKRGGSECYALQAFAHVIVAVGALPEDAAVLAVDATGNTRWRFGSTSEAFLPTSIAIDGDLVVASGVELGHGRIVSLNSEGKLVSSKLYSADLDARAVAVGPDHSVVIGGQLAGTADFGLGEIVQPEKVPPGSPTNFDGLIARLTADWAGVSIPPTQPSPRP